MSTTIRTIWAIAKSPELALTDEELHLLVSAHTGKDSLRDLTPHEIHAVVGVLGTMKTRAGRRAGRCRGKSSTANQRKKIYKLQETLGWDKPSRIRGMCRRMFGIEQVEWLSYEQCSKLIEALKKMAERAPQEEGKQ